MSSQPLQASEGESGVGASAESAGSSSSVRRNSRFYPFLTNIPSPPPWLGRLLAFLTCVMLFYVLVLVLFKSAAYPGSSLFTFLALWLSCIVVGYLLALTKVIPPLFGMIAVGVAFANMPVVSEQAEALSRRWTANFRVGAFCVVLMQAGLGLDLDALKRLKGVCFRLAFMPCCVEAVTIGVVAHFLLGLPFAYSFLLGYYSRSNDCADDPYFDSATNEERNEAMVKTSAAFIRKLEIITHGVLDEVYHGVSWCFAVGAVTPAVLVPLMLSLKASGLGVAKGIPTLVIASSSIDDILAITAFSLLVGTAMRTGHQEQGLLPEPMVTKLSQLNETMAAVNDTQPASAIAWTVLQGPIVVLLGIGYGCVVGALLWRFPPRNANLSVLFRTTLMCLACGVAMFGSMAIKMGGAGPLATLSTTFVASVGWTGWEGAEQVSQTLDIMWFIAQPFLFGLIGSEVRLRDLDPQVIGIGVGVLLIGLTTRMICTYFTTTFAGFDRKERLFLALAWLPKATVQAALAPVMLDTITKRTAMDPAIKEVHLFFARRVMNVLILSIVLTAPLGAVIISATAKYLLRRENSVPTLLTEKGPREE